MDLDDTQEPAQTFCSRCGSPAAEDANYCSRCGHALHGSAVPTLADDALGEPAHMPLAGEAHAPAFATSPAPAYAGAYTPAGALGAPAYMGGYAPAAGPAFVGDVAPVRYGGFWRRLWAFVVDSILVWFLTALVQLAMRVNVLMPDYSAWPDRIALLFGIVISWLYAALFMSSRWQGTLAQQVLDLRVTDLSGRRISFLRATARHFAEYGSALLLCLGYAPILFHERRQALHDLIAGTLVVRGGQDS